MNNYAEIARQSRLTVLDLVFKAQSSHVGSNFSCSEILAVLYEMLPPEQIIVSKGWVAASVYFHLVRKGVLPPEALTTYCEPDSPYIGLIEPLPGIPFACGSMGSGFPMAVGRAIAWPDKQVVVVMSDGELDCGTTWEAANIARAFKLQNLTVIVDANGHQAMSRTKDVLGITPQTAFPGWSVYKVDGHDCEMIEDALMHSGPKAIIARTEKGHGVSFMVDQNVWHYRAPNPDEYEAAKKELNV